jgi:hypothetical protein
MIFESDIEEGDCYLRAWEAGREANVLGAALADCPYKEETPCWRGWRDGFYEVEKWGGIANEH